jgi:hypothetical protein
VAAARSGSMQDEVETAGWQICAGLSTVSPQKMARATLAVYAQPHLTQGVPGQGRENQPRAVARARMP